MLLQISQPIPYTMAQPLRLSIDDTAAAQQPLHRSSSCFSTVGTEISSRSGLLEVERDSKGCLRESVPRSTGHSKAACVLRQDAFEDHELDTALITAWQTMDDIMTR